MASICIVGHGPSIYSGLGSVIDSMQVVRLKKGLHKKADPKHWGSRTDAICARSLIYQQAGIEFWHFADDRKWLDFYREFSHMKPSTGLCAVFCAVDRGHKDIALIGFDDLLQQIPRTAHDMKAEIRALRALDVKVVDLRTVQSGQVYREKHDDRSRDVGGLNDSGPPPAVPLPTGRRADPGSGDGRTQLRLRRQGRQAD